MPAVPNPPWGEGTWHEDAWAAGTWGASSGGASPMGARYRHGYRYGWLSLVWLLVR